MGNYRMKISLLFLIMFLLIGVVTAQNFCVDFDNPSAPPNLAITSSGQNIILTWEDAIDVPNCSGIDYYNVARDGSLIAQHITVLTYTDLNVSYGTYSYSVYAIDKVGHDSNSTKNDIVFSAPSGGVGTTIGGGGGGGGGVSIPFVSLLAGENTIQKKVYYTFSFGTEEHKLELTAVGEDYAEISISSTPKSLTLNLEETKEVDINNDNLSDISIKLISLSSPGKAVIDFQKINQIVPTGGKNETQPAPDLKELTPGGFLAGITGAVIGVLGTGGTILVVISIIVLIGIAVTLSVRKFRKR